MPKSAFVIINPNAGKEKALNYKEKLKEKLSKDYSTVDIYETEAEGDANKGAKKAVKEDYELVLAVGGDGTVNEVINGLASEKEPPLLAIVPMGTVNDLAQALNIPLNPEEAINLITGGSVKEIDLGLANNTYFTNFLVVGEASKAIHDVSNEEKTKLGPLAYFIESGKKLTDEDRFDINIQTADDEWEGRVSLVIVALIDSLGGLDSILTDAKIGDGKFMVMIIEKFNFSQLINMTPKILAGKIKESKNIRSFKTDKVHIKSFSEKEVPSDLDGEKGPNLPIDFKIFPRKIKVISNLE